MPHPDSTAGPLTIQDLIDLDRDPRPGALYRALTGMSDQRLQSLDTKLTAALPDVMGAVEHEVLAVIRANARRVLAGRRSKTIYSRLLGEAV